MMMKISCVIPTYNAMRYLRMGLESLSLQQLSADITFEVIVVDDGSTDDTLSVVEAYRSVIPHMRYVFRPRDQSANRSRARNLGIERAAGCAICFLDAGVIVPPDFIANTAKRLAEHDQVMLAHETLGLFIDPEVIDTSVLEGFTVDQLDRYARRIRQLPAWRDPRAKNAQIIQHNLSALPAPWTEGWSCALTVPAPLIERAGGFDERFYGWGVEDIEFVYRLRDAGGILRYETEAYALHYPHPISHSAAKVQSLQHNIVQMNRMHYQLDTECQLAYHERYYQAFLEKMNHLPPAAYMPAAPSIPITVPREGKRLAIGFEPDWIQALGATHAFVFNRSAVRGWSERLPGVAVSYLIGVDTPFDHHAFEVIFLSDYIRVVHPYLASLIFTEVSRIGKRVIWIHADSDASPFPDVDPHVSERLKQICHQSERSEEGPFVPEYVPSPRRRFIMEKPYWTDKDTVCSLAARAGLTLEYAAYPAPVEAGRT